MRDEADRLALFETELDLLLERRRSVRGLFFQRSPVVRAPGSQCQSFRPGYTPDPAMQSLSRVTRRGNRSLFFRHLKRNRESDFDARGAIERSQSAETPSPRTIKRIAGLSRFVTSGIRADRRTGRFDRMNRMDGMVVGES